MGGFIFRIIDSLKWVYIYIYGTIFGKYLI